MFNFKQNKPEEIIDNLLGKLVYCDSIWVGEAKFKLFGKSYDIDIEMFDINKESVSDMQKESYRKIYKDGITEKIEEKAGDVIKKYSDDFNDIIYRPLSLFFKRNGECALVVSAVEKDNEYESQSIVINIFPEIKYYGSYEAYMSEVFFT